MERDTHVLAWFLAHFGLVVAHPGALPSLLHSVMKRSNDQDVGVLGRDLFWQGEAVTVRQGDDPEVISRQQTHRLCLRHDYIVS